MEASRLPTTILPRIFYLLRNSGIPHPFFRYVLTYLYRRSLHHPIRQKATKRTTYCSSDPIPKLQILNFQGKFQFLDSGYQSKNLRWKHNKLRIVASQGQVHLEQKDNSHQVLRHLATHLDTHLKSRVGKKICIIIYDLPFQCPIGNALAKASSCIPIHIVRK